MDVPEHCDISWQHQPFSEAPYRAPYLLTNRPIFSLTLFLSVLISLTPRSPGHCVFPRCATTPDTRGVHWRAPNLNRRQLGWETAVKTSSPPINMRGRRREEGVKSDRRGDGRALLSPHNQAEPIPPTPTLLSPPDNPADPSPTTTTTTPPSGPLGTETDTMLPASRQSLWR